MPEKEEKMENRKNGFCMLVAKMRRKRMKREISAVVSDFKVLA